MDEKEKIKKLISNNRNYWEKRALTNKLNTIENEEDYLKRINDIYNQANKDIDNKLAKIYQRYATNNSISLKEAYKILPKAMEKEYKDDVLDYIEKAKQGTKYKQYLLNQSLMHKHTILDKIKTEVKEVIYNIDLEETGGKFLEKIFTKSNYKNYYDSNKSIFEYVNKDKIENLINSSWKSIDNFSQSVWKDREKLASSLDDILIKGLATGQNYNKLIDDLSKRMETSKANAKRLIVTESARMENEGLLDSYKRLGVEKLKFIATLDSKTSDICRAEDGRIFNIEDAKIGLNIPPLHPYCRSVISPYYEGNDPEDRIYRDVNTGKSEKGEYKDYLEYLTKHLNNKEQAKALIETKNDNKSLELATKTTSNSTSLNIEDETIKDITGYEINDEYLEYIKRNQLNYLEEEKNSGNITDEQLIEFFKNLKELMENPKNEISIRVKIEALKEILKSKSIQNGYSLNTIKDIVYKKRLEAEKNLFNIPIHAKANKRPIYGYVSNKDIEYGMPAVKLSMYGDIRIILKNKIKDKSTFTLGDSLDRGATIYPSKLNNIKMYSTNVRDLIDIDDTGLRGYYGYPEVQIFSKLKLKDIYEIEISKKYEEDNELIEELKRNGIKINWI